jgi:TonB family protein
MIGRLLVPSNSRPLSESAVEKGQRRRTQLDLRTIIPADLPQMVLDAKSSIPAYMPLDVLSSRLVIPRDLPVVALDVRQSTPSHLPLAVLGTPVAVPKDARLYEIAAKPMQHPAEMGDLLEPDVMTTGEVNLIPQAPGGLQEEKRWVLRGASAILHAAAIALILLISTLIPAHTPTNEEIEMAARSLGELYLPPDMKTLRHQTPKPVIESPVVRIDPKVIRRLAPPELLPEPPASHEPPINMSQPSPAPGPNPTPSLPPSPAPRIDAPSPTPQLEPIKPPQQPPKSSLTIPRYSPGRAIQQSLDDVTRMGGSGRISRGAQGTVPSLGGGSGQEMSNGLTLLTDPEGVDFSSYLDRVLASVRRNWYSIIPESARMGEQGKVYIDFEIRRDGSVPPSEPTLLRTSGKDPLDRAALSSIRASSPFEPLPAAFGGPVIKLRFVFLYNLPLSAAQ